VIISRTPLRISFCGGGSDLPAFYRQHGGTVLSVAIRRYVYLSMHEYFESSGFILKYSKVETPNTVSEIEHRILRSVFTSEEISGVDFNSSADVPAGTGMGSSSAFTVGLLNLCNAYRGRFENAPTLAARACDVEIGKLGEPIGKQDQYACAIGGLNLLEFCPDDSVVVEAVPLARDARDRLEQNLQLFYLGGTRSASAILRKQVDQVNSERNTADTLKAMAQQARDLRVDLPKDVDVLGPYLHDAWERKRALVEGITNPFVDSVYQRALDAGATGGKLLGAGGSGFLLVYVPEGAQSEVRTALGDLRPYDVRFDMAGTTIVYAD
jgi:D-glycero-alpha-D-manno-heptose-7-phosphate kinase